mgnify:FL=1
MKKRVCHYALSRIKKLILENKFLITKSALKTAIEDFSFLEADILNQILTLENEHFYKSMTSHFDHTLWQDVYKKQINDSKAYVKVQISDENSVIISFKKEAEL